MELPIASNRNVTCCKCSFAEPHCPSHTQTQANCHSLFSLQTWMHISNLVVQMCSRNRTRGKQSCNRTNQCPCCFCSLPACVFVTSFTFPTSQPRQSQACQQEQISNCDASVECWNTTQNLLEETAKSASQSCDWVSVWSWRWLANGLSCALQTSVITSARSLGMLCLFSSSHSFDPLILSFWAVWRFPVALLPKVGAWQKFFPSEIFLCLADFKEQTCAVVHWVRSACFWNQWAQSLSWSSIGMCISASGDTPTSRQSAVPCQAAVEMCHVVSQQQAINWLGQHKEQHQWAHSFSKSICFG